VGEKVPDQLLPGTLDMMILRTLIRAPLHGYDIAESIQQISEAVLQVDEGALYQALHRMELRGLLDSEWGLSENNRRAKFYRLTASGGKHLAGETLRWSRLSLAVSRVMGTA
jgi:PadR family transcriptional regulator PadR